jgi:NitT/TauT family transport system ATP-binding protein
MKEATVAEHDHGPVEARASAVVVNEVCKVFGSGASAVTALDRVSFDVPKGSFVSILGPSGCGKSTLMRLIAGLQPISSGTIDVERHTPDEMRKAREFGIVFQQPILFDWRTVEQNVALPLQLIGTPKDERERRVSEMIELVGLKDFRKHRPWQLSGGMQQRVAIARALAFGPRFMMMDEPFGALDMMTRERMQTELLSIWASKPDTTIVFITHSISEAVLLSDRIVVMSARPGRVMRVVDIARPRTDEVRRAERFGEIESEIRELIFSQEHR